MPREWVPRALTVGQFKGDNHPVVQAHRRPLMVASGDFGTGHLSLAVWNGDSNDLAIMLGHGDGTFQASVNYPLPFPTEFPLGRILVAGDFRGESVLDIAALRSGGLTVLRGNGDGSFQAIGGPSFAGTPTGIAMADMRGSNRLDLLVVTINPNVLYVLLNNGDGTFATKVGYSLPSQSYGVTAGDFRGNGISDVAVTIPSNPRIVVYRGNGDGTLGSTVTYPAPNGPFAVVAAPLRQAGLLDLAYAAQPVGDPNTATVELLLNDGTGTFTPGGSYTVGGFPLDIAAVDLDGSGRPDLLSAGSATGAISVLKNLGSGSFVPAKHYGAGVQPTSLTIGDFNEDGRLDIIAASNDVVVLLLGT